MDEQGSTRREQAAEPGAGDLVEVAEVTSVRRAPRFGAFIAAGIALGVALAAGALVGLAVGGGTVAELTVAVVVYAVLAGVLLGALAGGMVAVVVDRRSAIGDKPPIGRVS